MEEYTNQYEFGCFGPCRSGHHAILLWVAQSISDKREVWFFPLVEPFEDPFQYSHKHEIILKNHPCFNTYNLEDVRNFPQKYRFIKKKCLMYDYEDTLDFKNYAESKIYLKREKFFGKSKNYKNIIMLRDPFNNLASVIKSDFTLTKSKFISIWKAHAREFLGIKNNINNKVCISYNKWFNSEDYRKDIANKLSIPFTNSGLQTVTRWGFGSSFDSMSFNGKAQKMAVLERWKSYQNNAFYRRILKDKELWELSDQIFGHIPGTEVLKDSKLFSK